MKSVSLSGSLRENVGKKDAKRNRKLGNVPCVLYGGKEQIHFIAEDKNFKKIIFTPEVFIINLNLNGKKINALLQDIQYHPVTDQILHADFLEIVPEKPVSIAIPIQLKGTAPGAIKGGRLIKKIRKLKIKALVENLPDEIIIDISNLEIGDKIKISDLSENNFTFLDKPNTIVVGVFTARTIIEEESTEMEKIESTEESEKSDKSEKHEKSEGDNSSEKTSK